jgi:hypothetical protein
MGFAIVSFCHGALAQQARESAPDPREEREGQPLPSGEIGTVLNILFKDGRQEALRAQQPPALRLRDLADPTDAREVQARLARLGYLGKAQEEWSAQAAQALKRFKIAYDLGADEAFDEATQRVLFDRALVEEASFVGLWAPNANACSPRSNAAGQLPATINHEGAWAGQVSCAFRNSKRVGDVWHFSAACKGARTRWSSSVRLTVNGDRLTWASRRGVTHYVRCKAPSGAAR